jgi:tetratricopeptide (TPR) repeat protein
MAIRYLKEALDRDPRNALAWAELARAHIIEGGHGWVSVEVGYGHARDAAERALELEPDLAEAHARMGWIQMYHDRDSRLAEASYHRALELSPGNAEVLRGAGMLARTLGRREGTGRAPAPCRGAGSLERGRLPHARDRPPRRDHFVEAEEAYRKALMLAPQRILARAGLAMALLAQQRGEEALAEALQEPQEPFRLWSLAMVHHGLGHSAESDAALAELTEKYSHDAACQIAEVHGARGEADQAFEWLNRAYLQRDAGIPDTIQSPSLRSLHADPRWAEFRRNDRVHRSVNPAVLA